MFTIRKLLPSLVFCSTGGLVWVGYTQIWTTRAQLRAYVDVAPRGVTTLVNKPDVLAHLAFVNRGHLPARKLRAGIKIKWSDNDDLDTLDEVEIGKVSTILRPGTEAEQGTSPVNAAETSNVNAELGFVYVWGKIEYEDGFGKNRWRIFCHRYN